MAGIPEKQACYMLRDIKKSWSSGFEISVPSLDIFEGESIGFAGPNGSGKSSLLNIFAFLTSPLEGTLHYFGKPVAPGFEFQREVTILMQEPYLLKKSVFENIAYGLRKRRDVSRLEERVHHAMRLVALDPGVFAGRKHYQLSGGEARRVALAARLVLRPRVLILDEPVSGIDSESILHIGEAILSMKKEYPLTLLATSHDMVWLDGVTDEIMRVHGGRIIASGVENILHGPWARDHGDLYSMILPGGTKIYAGEPPDETSAGIIDPGDIMISPRAPGSISAQNRLSGKIAAMTEEKRGKGVRITAVIDMIELNSTITHEAQLELKLYPGKNVFFLFKASSVRWS